MNEILQYLRNPNDYEGGIELFKKYGGKSVEIQFFESSDSKMNRSLLFKKLQNIYRIASQKGELKADTPVKMNNEPIRIKRMHFSDVEIELQESKLLTNKLLSRDWNELDNKEKTYFKNNQSIFSYKKTLLINNSVIESELKSLHAALSIASNDDYRQVIADKLVNLKKRQALNWTEIDNFDNPKIESEESAHMDKAELMQMRNNLRARISKLQKKVKNLDPTVADNSNSATKLFTAREELKEIESKL